MFAQQYTVNMRIHNVAAAKAITALGALRDESQKWTDNNNRGDVKQRVSFFPNFYVNRHQSMLHSVT